MGDDIVRLFPDASDRASVVKMLSNLATSERVRKYTYYEWCKLVGVEVRAEDVELITGRPAGEV